MKKSAHSSIANIKVRSFFDAVIKSMPYKALNIVVLRLEQSCTVISRNLYAVRFYFIIVIDGFPHRFKNT